MLSRDQSTRSGIPASGSSRRIADIDRPLCAFIGATKRQATGCTRRGSDGSGPAARGCPAMLGRMAPSPTRFAHFVRAARTAATSQRTRRAGKPARGPRALRFSASPIRPCGHSPPPCRRRWCSPRRPPSLPSRQAAPGRGDLWGAEKRSAAGGVRRAAPDRRGGSMRRRGSAVAEPPQPPRGASIAGQSRAAGPPQCEPLAGAACRDARRCTSE